MTERTEEATLGGGCFWCLEAVFQKLAGVDAVESGYTGGSVARPTYQQVCAGDTGHAEVVRVHFDPGVIDYADLLRIFLTIHDPTTRNRQGADVGSQYRSIILYHSDAQRMAAERVMQEVEARELYTDPLVTELVPAAEFWPAEAYHRDYYRQHRSQPYCRIVIDPKVAKLRSTFRDRLRSPA